jgi:hypothetical protein
MILTSPAQFLDDNALSDYLSDELRNARLALVLGSGISAAFGLPTWDGLVDACCLAKNITITTPRLDNRDLAEEVRVACASYEDYLNVVQTNLYKGVSIRLDALRANATLSALGSLVMSSVRGSVTNVITYNVDDLLELYLDYHVFRTHVVHDVPIWNERADVRIIHPHGYLPSHSRHLRTSWILFDRSSYSDRAAREELWREEQLPVLRRNTCLFVGLSPRDDELDTLISHIKHDHPCRSTSVPFWAIRFSVRSGDSNSDQRESQKMAERGLFLKFVTDYHTDLPRFLFEICQKAAGVTI